MLKVTSQIQTAEEFDCYAFLSQFCFSHDHQLGQRGSVYGVLVELCGCECMFISMQIQQVVVLKSHRGRIRHRGLTIRFPCRQTKVHNTWIFIMPYLKSPLPHKQFLPVSSQGLAWHRPPILPHNSNTIDTRDCFKAKAANGQASVFPPHN